MILHPASLLSAPLRATWPPSRLNPSRLSLSSSPRFSAASPLSRQFLHPLSPLPRMLDVDRFHRGGSGVGISRSQRREKSPHRSPGSSNVAAPDLRPSGGVVGDLLLPPDGARGGGNGQMRKQAIALKVELDGNAAIPVKHHMARSSKKASGTPVKILMEKEMQNHVESRRHSSSVIAKLMGLDPLPARQPCDMQKESVMCFHQGSSEGFPETHMSCEERRQEFKDIFEVLETKAVEKHNWHAAKRLRRRDKEIGIVRQKFMDAKHLSTDDKPQNSEELSEALEVLNSSKDLYVKFQEEPTSLFEKYLRDLHSVPATPEGSHITILRSSHISKHKNSKMCQKSERKTEKNTAMRWSAMHKPEADIFIPAIKEHTVSYSRKLSKSEHSGNIEVSSVPTRIVVLKPNLEKGQKSARIRSTMENFQLSNLGYRGRRESRKSGNLGLFSDSRERQELSDDVEVTHRARGSREMAKEIAKHMRHTITGDYVRSCGPGYSMFPGHGNLHRMPGASACTDSEAVRQASGHVDGSYKSYSSSYLTETYASMEARKRLSERWRMTHKSQEVALADHGLSTLGEMLALSDRETPDMHSSSLSCQKASHVRVGREVPSRWISPSGISSRDGWKDGGCSSHLLRSKSLPTSSTIYENPNSADMPGANHIDNPFMLKDILNLGSRKFSVEKSFNQRFVSPHRDVKNCLSMSQSSSCDEEENKLPVREIHVDQNKLLNGHDSKNSSVEKFALSESSTCSISNTSYMADCKPVASDAGPKLPCLIAEQQLAQSFGSSGPAADECSPAHYEKEIVAKETLENQPEAGSSPSSHTQVTGQACSVIAKEVEQSSPISVLEPLDENECSPESFERVSADLQELRMQLELLKLESRDTYADRSVVNNEDAGGEIIDVSVVGGDPSTFGDEDDRDFSYILNVLRDSGFHSADGDALFSAFYSSDFPVCPDVFERVEKNYGVVTWSRAERKLLFDLVNSVLADILALNMEQRPWAKPRRVDRLVGCRRNLAEEVWQSLVRRRTVAIGDDSGKFMDDIKWLNLEDDIDSIGREVEKMLKDDLFEELIADCFSMHQEM